MISSVCTTVTRILTFLLPETKEQSDKVTKGKQHSRHLRQWSHWQCNHILQVNCCCCAESTRVLLCPRKNRKRKRISEREREKERMRKKERKRKRMREWENERMREREKERKCFWFPKSNVLHTSIKVVCCFWCEKALPLMTKWWNRIYFYWNFYWNFY